MKPLRVLFGERVRELRLARGLKQDEFAEKCGFARSYMSRVETGGANPSLDAIQTMATALRVSVRDLFSSSRGRRACASMRARSVLGTKRVAHRRAASTLPTTASNARRLAWPIQGVDRHAACESS